MYVEISEEKEFIKSFPRLKKVSLTFRVPVKLRASFLSQRVHQVDFSLNQFQFNFRAVFTNLKKNLQIEAKSSRKLFSHCCTTRCSSLDAECSFCRPPALLKMQFRSVECSLCALVEDSELRAISPTIQGQSSNWWTSSFLPSTTELSSSLFRFDWEPSLSTCRKSLAQTSSSARWDYCSAKATFERPRCRQSGAARLGSFWSASWFATTADEPNAEQTIQVEIGARRWDSLCCDSEQFAFRKFLRMSIWNETFSIMQFQLKIWIFFTFHHRAWRESVGICRWTLLWSSVAPRPFQRSKWAWKRSPSCGCRRKPDTRSQRASCPVPKCGLGTLENLPWTTRRRDRARRSSSMRRTRSIGWTQERLKWFDHSEFFLSSHQSRPSPASRTRWPCRRTIGWYAVDPKTRWIAQRPRWDGTSIGPVEGGQ